MRYWPGITSGNDANCIGCSWAPGPDGVYQVKAPAAICLHPEHAQAAGEGPAPLRPVLPPLPGIRKKH